MRHMLGSLRPLLSPDIWCAFPQGLDFFFANRQHAVKLVDFLQASALPRALLLHPAHQRPHQHKASSL